MTKIFNLKIRENGVVIIPKALREALKYQLNITLENVKGQTKATLDIPKYTLYDVLYELPPLKPHKKGVTKADIRNAREEAAVKRYKKSLE